MKARSYAVGLFVGLAVAAMAGLFAVCEAALLVPSGVSTETRIVIGDNGDVKVAFAVSGADLGPIKPGQSIQVQLQPNGKPAAWIKTEDGFDVPVLFGKVEAGDAVSNDTVTAIKAWKRQRAATPVGVPDFIVRCGGDADMNVYFRDAALLPWYCGTSLAQQPGASAAPGSLVVEPAK